MLDEVCLPCSAPSVAGDDSVSPALISISCGRMNLLGKKTKQKNDQTLRQVHKMKYNEQMTTCIVYVSRLIA